MLFPSSTRWKASTETAVRVSHIRSALRNAADGSMATTCTPRRPSSGRAKSHSSMPLWSRPRPRRGPARCPGQQWCSSKARSASRHWWPGPCRTGRSGTCARRCPASWDPACPRPEVWWPPCSGRAGPATTRPRARRRPRWRRGRNQ